MKAHAFLIWIRDEIGACPTLPPPTNLPSNKVLKIWLREKVVRVNGVILSTESVVEWPIEDLVFFPNGKRKTTIR